MMMQRRKTVAVLILIMALVAACRDQPKAPPSSDEQIVMNIDSLKRTAKDGDLIVRLGDDLISYQIKFLNDSDRTYSHAGMILEEGGRKWVVHITPEAPGADTIQLTPIDSFLTPGKNLRCALYRYDLTDAERDYVHSAINAYRQQQVVFDRVYDLASNDSLYCSEMISKSLTSATHGRLQFRTASAPPNMVNLLLAYFKPEGLDRQTISQRRFVTIDNLYRRPECRLVMQFPLKFFPGHEQ